MQIFSRKGWLVCGVWAVMLCLGLQLRAADATVSSGSPDDLQSSLGDVVSGGGGTITVTTPILIGDTNVSDTVDWSFDGVSNVVLTASGNSLFVVEDGGSLTLSNMALVNGTSTNGGAVYVFTNGMATFVNCLFSNNVAQGLDGISFGTNSSSTNDGTGDVTSGTRRGAAAFGGAIFNLGNLSIFLCVFATNSAIGGTGGDGQAGRDAVTHGGDGTPGGGGGWAFGGGIYSAGPLFVMDSTFSDNFAQGGTAGIGGAGGSGLVSGATGSGGTGGSAGGAGLYCTNTNSVVVILSSTFANNLAQGGLSQTGGRGSAGLGIGGPHGGNAFGGGVDNDNGSSAVVTNCTFFENDANGGTGGNGGNGGGKGGNGGDGGNAVGGGLYNLGTVTVVNCTFSKGSAVGGTNGLAGSGNAVAKNGRRGNSRGGNVANASRNKKGSFTLVNSIIATNLSGGGGFGKFIDGGYNVIADRSIPFKRSGTSLTRTNPLVGDLAANGGPTKTIAILSNSPAVNFIQADDWPTNDQRGIRRPQLTFPDAGAFELNPFELSIITQPVSTNVPAGSNALFSVKVSGPGPMYQWYFDPSNVVVDPGDAIDGAISKTLLATNVGQYLVVITNNFGSAVTSSVVTLGLISNVPPVITNITISPSSPVLVGTTNVTITAAAGGTKPLAYQWFFMNFENGKTNMLTDDGNISGATNSILLIASAQTTNSGSYGVLVTNIAGSAFLGGATLIVSTNSSGSTNPAPPPVSLLQSDSVQNPRKVSFQAAGARVPVAPGTGDSASILSPRRAKVPEQSELRKNPISQAVPPGYEAVDGARLWTFWRGARLPCRTFRGRPRSFRAVA
jgi:hypothetical protein